MKDKATPTASTLRIHITAVLRHRDVTLTSCLHQQHAHSLASLQSLQTNIYVMSSAACHSGVSTVV